MGMQVNTNIAANNAYRNLATTQNDLSKSLEKLSSGLRINRAADDAAGLAISEGLKSQVGGLTVAARNAQDGISVIQTAEGSLNEVTSILQRMRDLAVQAGNDSNNTASRGAISTEVSSLRQELTRISDATNFNGTKLLSGDVDSVAAGNQTSLTFQVGANGDASSKISVNLAGANVSSIVTALTFGTTSVKSASAATVNYAKGYEFTQGSTVVTVAAPGTAPTSNAGVATNLNADAGFAQNFTASTDEAGKLVVTSKSGSASAITIDQDVTTAGTYAQAVTVVAGSTTLGFDSSAAAQASITAIDAQIQNVSTARAELGANQNRFESVIKNLAVSKENLTAAGSRIRDTDMAEEMVKYTRANILSQAGTAMLAQANQSNSGVLQLLQ
ncbi:flagellin [Cryobacterium sp. Y50]|uniref:flagellin N-terminal helical domain-containing protein n=1 Tax=Cryobacterium sp. Y50 TaxID=2048286 RepID=UPI000CE3349E|nr:flagellin [Cryobacterium sp. Y50]